jgi:hypothetical protein
LRIAKYLGISEHQILLVKNKIKFQRRPGEPGYRFHPTTAQFIQIMDLALSHQHSAREIARITGGKLDSYLLMKWAKNKIGADEQQRGREEEVGLYIVDAITNACFDGSPRILEA